MCTCALYWTMETRKLPELSTGQRTRSLPATISSVVETTTSFRRYFYISRANARFDVRVLNVFFFPELLRRRMKSLIIRKAECG